MDQGDPVKGSQVVATTKHGELTVDQLAAVQPGLGRIMPEISRRYWILYHAAQAGHWPLAQYQVNQIRHAMSVGSTLRPKHARKLEVFSQGILGRIEAAISSKDWAAFDDAYQKGIANANANHIATGHGEIVWRLPPDPPPDLDLTPPRS